MTGARAGSAPVRSTRAGRWRRKLATLRPMEIFGLVAVGVLLVLAVIGPLIAPYPITEANPRERLLPPSVEHWFGTDENGMDVFSRILAAPRVDVTVAFIAVAIAVAVGTPLGVVAGFFEGSRRRVASLSGETILRLLDVIQAFPVFILAMVLVAIRGASTENLVIAIAFVNMPTFLRIARAEVLSLRERPFAEAARSIGAPDSRIAFRHLLPNAVGPLLTQVSVCMGFAILLTAGLSFVGAGVAPPTPELGGMIASGSKMMIIGFWWPSLFPGIALGLTVFSFAAAGEAVGRLLEPHSAAVTGAAARQEIAMPPGPLAPAPVTSGFAGPTHGAPEAEIIEAMTAVTSSSPTANGVRTNEVGPEIDHAMARPTECLLEIENLSVDFGDGGTATRALNDISLWVAPGETFGIVGESGSGKSVLVRAALRLLPEEGHVVGGEVRYRGRSILQMEPDELRRLRGVEFSPILPSAKLQLSPVTRVEDLMVLAYQAHAKGDRKTAVARAVEVLRLVGIQDPERRLKAYPHELSGGMAQRVCIALALLHDPRLVIADEPTSGLDVTVQRQVLDEMVAAARGRGAAQMIVTRDFGIVAQYCQRMAVMHGGRIVETGYTMDVFRDPQHPYTRRLLDAAVITTTRGAELPGPAAEATAVPA